MEPLDKKPSVSIIIPVFNDEQYIEQAIESCLNQTLTTVEVICVDDRSTDNTAEVIKQIAATDTRVKLVQHDKNMSALNARRTGIKHARADYILFLDGDDELRSDAAEITYNNAIKTGSDLVGFGLRIITKTGRLYGFEDSIQPSSKSLEGEEIIKNLFTPGQPAQGQLVRFMYRKKLLEKAYRNVPEENIFHRAEDKLISFQAASYAKRYTSTQSKLYTYHIYRGGSDYLDIDLEKFNLYASAIDTIDFLGDIVAKYLPKKRSIIESYTSTRLATIAIVIKRVTSVAQDYRQQSIENILKKISALEFIAAIATFQPDLLELARIHVASVSMGSVEKSKNVALYIPDLTIGVQDQATKQLQDIKKAGYNITLITHKASPISLEGIDVKLQDGSIEYQKIHSLAEILQSKKIDTFIDHDIYSTSWPFRMVLAKTFGIKTIAWSHQSSLQPVKDSSELGEFMIENINLVDKLIVPSTLDVVFWKTLNYETVYALPTSTRECSQLYKQLLDNAPSAEFSPGQNSEQLRLLLKKTFSFAKKAGIKNEAREKVCAQKLEAMQKSLFETKSRTDTLERELQAIKSSKKYKLATYIARSLHFFRRKPSGGER